MQTMIADAKFWDRAARKYAAATIRDMSGYERTLARTREHLSPEDNVLEIGCGTGTTALSLAPFVRQMLATDVSGEMIGIARERAADKACPNIAFEVAAPETMPPRQTPFDAVLGFNLWHLVKDRAAAFGHVRRLVKPGGLFISKTPCLSEMNPLIRLAVPAMRLIGKAPFVDFFRAEELEEEIAAAGFSIVETARHGSGRKDARIFIVARRNT